MIRRYCIMLAVCCSVALIAGPASVAQQVYKSISPNGHIIFSDRPPAARENSKILSVVDLPASRLPEAALRAREAFLRNLPPAPESPITSPAALSGVRLFSASWCRHCREAKTWLAQQNIPYQEVDVDSPQGQLAFAKAGGGKGVPFILAAGQRLTGFSAAGYQALFATR